MMSDEWTSLFLLLWFPRRDFCSLFLLLWLSVGLRKLKLAAARFETSTLFTFYHGKICQGSWCRCQTYPTWAPRGRLPSFASNIYPLASNIYPLASNIYHPSCKDYSTRHGARFYLTWHCLSLPNFSRRFVDNITLKTIQPIQFNFRYWINF